MSGTAPTLDAEMLLRHADFVRGVARALLRDEHAAEDVVQDTWLTALRGGGPDRSGMRSWLGGVARNLARVRLRGERRRAEREIASSRPEGVPSDLDVLERERARRRVVAAVLALDEPYRATLLLRFFEDLPPREVARRMDVPPETVRTRTRRALELVRAALVGERAERRRAWGVALVALAGNDTARTGPGAVGGLTMAVGTKIGAAAAVLAAAAVVWALWPRDDGAVPPPGRAPVAPARDEDARGPERAPRPWAEADAAAAAAAAPAPSQEPIVRGRCADTDGNAVPGVRVIVYRADGSEFAAPCDADGRFEARVEGAARVRLVPAWDAAHEPVDPAPREVPVPSSGVDFVVRRFPTATVVVRVADLDEGRPLQDFRCSVESTGVSFQTATRGTLEARVRLPQPRGAIVTVRLFQPEPPEPTLSRVAASDGDRVEVAFALRRGEAIRGRVVDASGDPAADALVFFGSHLRGRGDEPFKPFKPERILDGVRTAADGSFELRGKGTVVSAWRADSGVTTRSLPDAAHIALAPLGAIRGRLVDAAGRPVAAAKLMLDRTKPAETDAEGRFAFDGVDAGVRGVLVEREKRYVGVRVRAGATSEVEILRGPDEIRIPWEGAAPKDAVVVGLGDVAAVDVPSVAAGELVLHGVPTGSYLLLARGGVVARVEVDGSSGRIERGACALVVRAKPGVRVFAVPAGSSELVDRLAARAGTITVPADGVARFERLTPGWYAVGFDRGSEDDLLREDVEVPPQGAEITVE